MVTFAAMDAALTRNIWRYYAFQIVSSLTFFVPVVVLYRQVKASVTARQ